MIYLKQFVSALLAILFLSTPAYSALVTQNYSLIVTHADPFNLFNVAVGDEINGYFSYDNTSISKTGAYRIGQSWGGSENPLSVDEFQEWASSFHLDNTFWSGPVFPYPPVNGHPYIDFSSCEIVGIELLDHWDMYSMERVSISGFHFNAWGHVMLDWDVEWSVDGTLRLYDIPEMTTIYLLIFGFFSIFGIVTVKKYAS